ncbi:hypothetical protein [Sandaracinus amylolyticus]|uniref:hypothetical protein n=1 Tax=Sandaracinus amylolyticus TaxID=927083 RepID=UPI001F340FA8|nr:hypothetical protein [Sandaracinus amylolyticus]UJR81401.1 Hypothetical protein I5071_34590 [Sandaracinus amylolyticus]
MLDLAGVVDRGAEQDVRAIEIDPESRPERVEQRLRGFDDELVVADEPGRSAAGREPRERVAGCRRRRASGWDQWLPIF